MAQRKTTPGINGTQLLVGIEVHSSPELAFKSVPGRLRAGRATPTASAFSSGWPGYGCAGSSRAIFGCVAEEELVLHDWERVVSDIYRNYTHFNDALWPC